MTHAPKPAIGGLRFEVLAEVAVGRSSRVDLCRTTAPAAGQLVAVKRLLPEIAAEPALAKRFLDEVWMTSALRHPNVVGVVGWGEDEAGAYLAVELVQGVSLARLMKTVVETREEFPERLVVFICGSIARGLAAAHELKSDRGDPLGLVHRDLGPGNVLVGFNGDVKIADFGLALAKDRLSHTTAALPVRSVSHLSPEELRGERVDQRADVYSLGVILFELLVGRPAYTGEDDLELVRAVVNGPVPDPLPFRPRMDKALAELVKQCLDKSPAGRPPSARVIANQLDVWLATHGYREENVEALARFIRRNSMRQMRWFERIVGGRDAPEIENTALPVPRGRDSLPTKETETTVMEASRKSKEPPRRSRAAIASAPTRDEDDRGGLPRLNQDDEEESDNVTTIAVKKADLASAPRPASPAPEAHAATPAAPARPLEETTSDVIELLSEDSSTEGGPQSFRDRAAPTKPPLLPKGPQAPVTISSAAEPPAAAARPVVPVFGPRPPAQSSPSIDSATMTLPTQLLAPEYIAHQVERLKGNAHKKKAEAEQAREEAEAARLEAEEAEEAVRVAEKAVAMAVEALHMAEDNQTSRAAEKLEEALSLVDGPVPPMS